MVRIKDRHQQHLFDPWDFMSPKRRKMLDSDWPGFFREYILDLLPVEAFSVLFPHKNGRPTKEMYTVLGTLALQQYHDLTDIEAVNQLSYNIQWHYALDIPEESDQAKYICPKTLWTMRTLATELGIDTVLFEAVSKNLAELFQVDTSHQRIDSVHIQSNMARLGRIGILVKGIDRFLVNLQRQHPRLWKQVDNQLVERYQGEEARECFGGVKPSQSRKILSEVASDLYRLVKQFEDRRQVANMTSYKLLCRIVEEQCEIQADGTIDVKAPKEIRSDSLQNPSDPDATYCGHKGQGYQVQVMETYVEHEEPSKQAAQLNLITYIEVEKACQGDAQALLPAIEKTIEKDLAPEQIQADSLYGSDQNLQEAAEHGVEVISPAMGTEKGEGVHLSDFEFTDAGHIEKCPAGHAPSVCKKKKGRYSQGFEVELCQNCPFVETCPAKKSANYFFVRYTAKDMRLAKRRRFERSEAFKEKYRWRAGAEATMSQYDRLTGVKHLRVRGFKAVRFAAIMKATAVNIARAVAVKSARDRVKSSDQSHDFFFTRVYQIVKERIRSVFRFLFMKPPKTGMLCTYAHYA